MVSYPHFAVQNLLLVNGYQETRTPEGILRTYEQEDLLEKCVRRVLFRKPERLRGWDLRFLRRGLELSQDKFGRMVDRDSQTVARWEKSKRPVPVFVDLMIRCRFAERFESAISLKEILSYVDGTAPKLPRVVLLAFEDNDWSFSFRPRIVLGQTIAHSESTLVLPRAPESAVVFYTGESRGEIVRFKPSAAVKHKREGVTLWESVGQVFLRSGQPETAPLQTTEYESIGLENVGSGETRH